MKAIISRSSTSKNFFNNCVCNLILRTGTVNECYSTRNNGVLRIFPCGSTGKLHNVAGESAGCQGPVPDTYEQKISSVISTYPDLPHLSSHLRKFLDFATTTGFSLDEGFAMVIKCKEVLGKSESHLYGTTSSLRQCKFNDDDIRFILKSAPELFSADPDVILQRYASLRNEFSHKLIKEMFCNCPSVTFMKWKNIQDKIKYLKTVMFVSKSQIARSNALKCPLNIIKARHTLLERAGVFKIPNPKSNIPSKNPSLSAILDTEDEYFAVKVAGLTSEEYFVFLEMFAAFDSESMESEDDDSE